MRLRHAMVMGSGRYPSLTESKNPMALEMEGIRNCGTVKKVRA